MSNATPRTSTRPHATPGDACAYRLTASHLDSGGTLCLDLTDGEGDCFLEVAVDLYDDGRGPYLDRYQLLTSRAWTCAAPSEAVALAWLAANRSAIEDAAFAAMEKRS